MTPRNYFAQSADLVHPTGRQVEILEIRPLRPNQDVILPGVTVTGRGVKFECRDKGHYKSRNGYAQCDGISQFSGSFYDNAQIHNKPGRDLDYHQNFIDFQSVQQCPKSGFHGQAKQARLKHFDFNSRLYQASPSTPSSMLLSSYRPTIRDVQKQLEEARFMGNLQQQRSRGSRTPSRASGRQRKYAFGRTIYDHENNKTTPDGSANLPRIRYQNYMDLSDNMIIGRQKEQIHTKSSFRSRSGCNGGFRMSSTPGRKSKTDMLLRPKSLEELSRTYDYLYDRHMRQLMTLATETNVKMESQSVDEFLRQDPDDSSSSFDESEKLSALGDELVQRSLEEVTHGLNALTPGSRSTSEKSLIVEIPSTRENQSRNGKRVTFAQKDQGDEGKPNNGRSQQNQANFSSGGEEEDPKDCLENNSS